MRRFWHDRSGMMTVELALVLVLLAVVTTGFVTFSMYVSAQNAVRDVAKGVVLTYARTGDETAAQREAQRLIGLEWQHLHFGPVQLSRTATEVTATVTATSPSIWPIHPQPYPHLRTMVYPIW